MSRSLPILNEQDGPADWQPMRFRVAVAELGHVEAQGIAKRHFGVVCPGANPFGALGMNDVAHNVMVVHLPTGLHIAGAGNGPRAFRLADALMVKVPEFARPFDESKLDARGADILALIAEHKAIR